MVKFIMQKGRFTDDSLKAPVHVYSVDVAFRPYQSLVDDDHHLEAH